MMMIHNDDNYSSIVINVKTVKKISIKTLKRFSGKKIWNSETLNIYPGIHKIKEINA